MHEILLNIESREIRYAQLKKGTLCDLVVERKRERQTTGNIYKGRVTNILQNIQSAFIDIHEGENGFIHLSDIIENTKRLEEMFDMDFELASQQEERETEAARIDQILKPDQYVIVQVVKEAIGTKGARLTSKISIPGRYLVMLPNSPHRGVSKKIEDRETRERLKRIIRSFEMPQEMGFICRTASQNASQEMLVLEANELAATWHDIVEKYKKSERSGVLYEESDLIKKAVVNAVDKKMDRILVDDYQIYQQCRRLYAPYATEHSLKIELYRDKFPMFERFGVEREIEKSLKRKLWLNSGGYLFFDQTEAMHTIDVNSGRSTNIESGDVEETLVRINLEAAEEIAKQLKIRNIGGLIICDFIDMRSKKNQRRVLEYLKDSMKEDSAKCTILGMSEFGLIEMTRQRNRGSLLQTVYTQCPYCTGTGKVKTHESITIEIERDLKKIVYCLQQYAVKVIVHPELMKHINQYDKNYFQESADTMNARISWETNDSVHLNEYHFISSINNQRIEV
ncbi:MAG: Rne/Rng family ribonuclease [Chlamydia sp.]